MLLGGPFERITRNSGAKRGPMESAIMPTPHMAAGEPAANVRHWSPALRLAFRFCFTYLSIFSLSTQILTGLFVLPGVRFGRLGLLSPPREITAWTARHIFGVNHPMIYTGNGSGDKTFDWGQD